MADSGAGSDPSGLTFPSLGSTGPSSLAGPDSNLSLGDSDPDFVNETDQLRFMCLVHKGVLRDTRQTSCGHRLCARCVEVWLNGKATRRCPAGESDCDDVTPSNVFPDRSIQREMKDVPVFCKNKKEGCKQKLKLKDLASHFAACEFESVPCDFASRGCNEEVLRCKLTEHKGRCPYRPVRCSMCRMEINHNQFQNHEDDICPEKTTGCPFGCGNKTLKRKEVDNHKSSCPVQPVDCNFKPMGCTYMAKREDVEKHKKEDLSKHLELVTEHVAGLELKSLDTQAQIRTISQERDQLEQSMQSSRGMDGGLQGQVHQLETQHRDFRLKLVSMMEKVIIVERKMPDLAERGRVEAVEQNLTAIQQRITQLEQMREREQQQQSGPVGSGVAAGGSTRVGRWGTVENMAETFSTQLTAHDRQLGVHDVRMAEMDLRFQLLETASYDGTLVWKIRDYERRKRDAVNGRTLSLYSQPFYSGRFGYKMCARVYLNGDGMGKTTHMSLFFVVMRGEYDALLNWPFRQKVTLTLLDQSAEKRHLTDHFQPDPNSSSFQRPTSEMNVASGCPLFVSHAVLENPSNGYLRDDTIFIRIVVDLNPNPQNF
uniref:TNF receptor-associated factor 3-like protein n=1 Tax=Littorina littorea TaxID=31216 RepID=A0A7G8Z9Z1_LITLI|nr:TNF receptor-associated factor 3-like protein [Littorina littorea]